MFDSYLSLWGLAPDGRPMITRNARLLPVRWRDTPAMLKLKVGEEEDGEGALMEWWDGDGAARVLARHERALLLERAEGATSLADMARNGEDEQACRILCAVAARLHARRSKPYPQLTPLANPFRALEHAAAAHGGMLIRCARTAKSLLGAPRDVTVLHGDLHHGNVLDFGARGWLAIDPKGLVGERGFDFANIFTNPDLDDPACGIAVDARRFGRRVEVVAEAAGLERRRLLCWVLAWTGLSAAWFVSDGEPATIDIRVAELAAAELDR